MSTLSKRLRGGANLLRKPAGLSREDLYEAADELDRLTEEAADRYKSWCEMHSSFERGRDEIERLTARVALWQGLYRRALNEANGLTNYVEDRPELRSAEKRIQRIENDARALLEKKT